MMITLSLVKTKTYEASLVAIIIPTELLEIQTPNPDCTIKAYQVHDNYLADGYIP